MAIETLYADAHITGTFSNPANAVGPADGNWAGDLNANASYTSRWSMANPTGQTPQGTHTISVLARKGSNSGTPTIQINLYRNGVLIRSGSAQNVTDSTFGQEILQTFSAADLEPVNDVEIEVVQTGVGGSPSTRNSAQIELIEWEGDFITVTSIVKVEGETTQQSEANQKVVTTEFPKVFGDFSIVGQEAVITGPDTGDITFPKPGGTVENTLLIMWCGHAGHASTGVTWTPPAGWTQIGVTLNQSGESHSVAFYKVAGPSEPADYTFSEDNVNRKHGLMLAVNGVDPNDPIHVNNQLGDANDVGAGITADITTTDIDRLLLIGLHKEQAGDVSPGVWSHPSADMTELYSEFSDDADDQQALGGYAELGATATTYNRTFEIDTGVEADNGQWTFVALNPALTGGSVLKVEGEIIQKTEQDLNPRALARLRAENLEGTEAVLSVRDRLRLVGESVEVIEADIAVRALLREIQELGDLSEAVSAHRGRLQQEGETVEGSEVTDGIRGILRQEGETGELSEAEEHYRGLFREISETLESTESTLRFLDLIRVLSESVDVTDDELRFMALVRTENETTSISEQDLSLLSLLRLISETSEISEADITVVTDTTGAIIKVEGESISVSEGDLLFMNLVRVVSELVDLADDDLRVMALVRIEDETTSLTTDDISALGLLKLVAENEEITEADIHVISDVTNLIVKVEGESISVTESTLTFLDLVRVVAESIDASESELRLRTLVRVEDEDMFALESDISARVMVRIENEVTELAEAIIAARSLLQMEQESITLTEMDLHQLGRSVVVSEDSFIEEISLKILGAVLPTPAFVEATVKLVRTSRSVQIKDSTRCVSVGSIRSVDIVDSRRRVDVVSSRRDVEW